MKLWRIYGSDEDMANLGFSAGAVVGPRGVGKTRLLRDVQARLNGLRELGGHGFMQEVSGPA